VAQQRHHTLDVSEQHLPCAVHGSCLAWQAEAAAELEDALATEPACATATTTATDTATATACVPANARLIRLAGDEVMQ